MKVNGIDFNAEWVRSLTEAQFMAHPAIKILWPNRADREQLLRNIYKLAKDGNN